MGRRLAALAGAMFLALGTLGAGAAHANGTVQFTAPPDGSSAPVNTPITPDGLASITGTTGQGLDLVLVLDSSGSMGINEPLPGGGSISRQQAQKDAAIALVNALPAATSSVSIVEFDGDANTVIGLTPLIPVSSKSAVIAAINGVDASGSTFIGSGIDAATSVLTGSGATAGRSSQMVVLSDGSTLGAPSANAAAAITAGVDNVHSVALPGAVVATMESIANSGNGVFVDASNPANIGNLASIFQGTGGSLVGIDRIEITLPDGTVIADNSVSGIGAFTVDQAYNIGLGANTWNVTAFFTDGTTATDTVTVNGTDANVVPLPAGLPLLLAGIGAFGVMRLRNRKG